MINYEERHQKFLTYLEELHTVESDRKALRVLWKKIATENGVVLAFSVFVGPLAELGENGKIRITKAVRAVFIEQASKIDPKRREVMNILELPDYPTEKPSYWTLQNAYDEVRGYHPDS